MDRAHSNARRKGWWEVLNGLDPDVREEVEDLLVATRIALIGSEAAEVLEAHRKGLGRIPLTEELADIVIRVGDLAGFLGIDLEAAIQQKLEKNESRPYMHGGCKY